MKISKFFILFCAMILILSLFCSLTACNNSDKKQSEQEKPDLNVNSSSITTEHSASTSSKVKNDTKAETYVEIEEDEDNPSFFKRLMDGVCDFLDIDNYKKSDRTFKKVVESIENQDKSELKSLFSKNAIKEAKNLDKNIEDLFDFVKGNVISFSSSKDIGRASSSTYDYGKEQTIIFPCFTLETDEEKYYFGIEQCVKDDSDHDNEGINYFCIINAEDWKDEHYYGPHYEDVFGIIID